MAERGRISAQDDVSKLHDVPPENDRPKTHTGACHQERRRVLFPILEGPNVAALAAILALHLITNFS